MDTDLGLTHVALAVTDLEASIAFYERYASMQVVHKRVSSDSGMSVAWISDLTRRFVVVLLESGEVVGRLEGVAHLGTAVSSRDEVDRLLAQAQAEGRKTFGPHDDGPPVGYWAFIADPDGHNLEVAFGQQVGLTVERSAGET